MSQPEQQKRYFKDQKFIIHYLYGDYIDLHYVENILIDDESNKKSLVIAAKGGDLCKFFDKSHVDNPVIKEIISHSGVPEDKLWKIRAWGEESEEEKKILIPDVEKRQLWDEILEYFKSTRFVQEWAMVLCVVDEKDHDLWLNDPSSIPKLDNEIYNECIVKKKIGGSELVAEFLLSKYPKFNRHEKEAFLAAGGVVDRRIRANKGKDNFFYSLDFSLGYRINVQDTGDDDEYDGTWWPGKPALFLNMNKKELGVLKNKVDPYPEWRFERLLTDDQKKIVTQQSVDLIKKNLSFIGKAVFNLDYDEEPEPPVVHHGIWSGDLSDFAGPDGYVGDGIYVRPDGSLDVD